MKTIYARALGGLLSVVIGMGALAFLPAWTFDYWQAWAFLAVFGVSGFVIMLYLVNRDPKLLERRMSAGPAAEKRTRQRIIMSIASMGFVALLVLPALDHRFAWSSVPPAASIAADVLVAIGWLVIFVVFRENSFTSATIEVAPDQTVISTGPYAIVRHPMYSGSILYMVSMPIALGSWWGLLVFVPLIPILVWRLFDEEGFLEKNLSGYTEYSQRVRYRLIPLVW
jgi:protein-S-isoprenylcysteine O-methyltransferase Ste14